MEPRLLSEATVDACAQCRGLWVDWFDGELVAIVKDAAPLSTRGDVALDAAGALCPRCAQPLAIEAFGGSIALWRCADCAGCFVPRASFTALLELEQPAASDEKRSALARLLLVIARLFGAEPTVRMDVPR